MFPIKRLLRSYVQDLRGVAAVEFGFILPILAFLMFGSFSIFQTFQVNRAVDRSSAITADLASRMTAIDDGQVDTLLEVAKSLIGGAAEDESYEIVLSSISNTFDSDGEYELSVDWSFSNKTGNELTDEEIDDFDIPTIPEGESVILVNIALEYSELFYQDHFGSIDLEQTAVRRPRFVPLVVYN